MSGVHDGAVWVVNDNGVGGDTFVYNMCIDGAEVTGAASVGNGWGLKWWWVGRIYNSGFKSVTSVKWVFNCYLCCRFPSGSLVWPAVVVAIDPLRLLLLLQRGLPKLMTLLLL